MRVCLISFLPAIFSTSTRMHGEFLCLLFLQAHRETEAHYTATGMSSQGNQPLTGVRGFLPRASGEFGLPAKRQGPVARPTYMTTVFTSFLHSV